MMALCSYRHRAGSGGNSKLQSTHAAGEKQTSSDMEDCMTSAARQEGVHDVARDLTKLSASKDTKYHIGKVDSFLASGILPFPH